MDHTNEEYMVFLSTKEIKRGAEPKKESALTIPATPTSPFAGTMKDYAKSFVSSLIYYIYMEEGKFPSN